MKTDLLKSWALLESQFKNQRLGHLLFSLSHLSPFFPLSYQSEPSGGYESPNSVAFREKALDDSLAFFSKIRVDIAACAVFDGMNKVIFWVTSSPLLVSSFPAAWKMSWLLVTDAWTFHSRVSTGYLDSFSSLTVWKPVIHRTIMFFFFWLITV